MINKKNSAMLLACVMLAAVLTANAKKPKNFRRMPKKSEQAAAPATRNSARVMRGRWSPPVLEAINKFIAEHGKTSATYDAARPPVAVLPWSDALVVGDPAELVFLRLVTKTEFRFSDEWWEIVPVAQGRQPARAAYEHFVEISSSTWSSSPEYSRYRKTMLESYLRLCREVGRRECRPYLMRLWAGWKDKDAVDYSRDVIEDEKKRPAGVEVVRFEDDDPAPLKMRRGLRLIAEMKDLVARLRDAGIDVWVIDDLPQPVLEAATIDYGVDPSRVIGVRAARDGAKLTAAILKPIPTRGGKAELIQSVLGRPPDFAIGRDAADVDVLAFGSGVRIVLSGDPALETKAQENGWLVQPPLAR